MKQPKKWWVAIKRALEGPAYLRGDVLEIIKEIQRDAAEDMKRRCLEVLKHAPADVHVTGSGFIQVRSPGAAIEAIPVLEYEAYED